MVLSFFKFVILVFVLVLFCQGCDDSGIIHYPPKYDTIHVNVKNRIISEGVLSSSYNSINLYYCTIVQEVNNNRDAILGCGYIDTSGIKYFCLRSGIISSYALGFKTKFIKTLYPDINQWQFDTITKIPDLDSLTGDDFTSDSSSFFTDSIPTHPVFGFYLEGKFLKGMTSKPVYGVIYIDSLYKDENGTSQFRIDIKSNKGGINEFK